MIKCNRCKYVSSPVLEEPCLSCNPSFMNNFVSKKITNKSIKKTVNKSIDTIMINSPKLEHELILVKSSGNIPMVHYGENAFSEEMFKHFSDICKYLFKQKI